MSDPKSRVCYFYNAATTSYYYGEGHPMKPQRLRLTHSLLLNYSLYHHLQVYKPHQASYQELIQFHSEDYIEFLRRISPDNAKTQMQNLERFNLGERTDCPAFEGIYDFCQLYTGGSIDGAHKLNHGMADICINWSGGLHHAKKAEASGFCYVNDIVLAILELLKYHARVLYIDIDIHHGDGVEEAFYTTDRVMTVSFHKFGDFFPGTGDIDDVGAGRGKNYSINFPLQAGMDDASFVGIFKPTIQKIIDKYQPGAIVLQCGADSLTGDRLGCFNLTLKGHGECVQFVKGFQLPLLVLGGGGYNIRNVARCWTYETAVLLGLEDTLDNSIPYNDFFQYYAPDYNLHLTPSSMDNENSQKSLEMMQMEVFDHLSYLDHAPSVQMHQVPPDMLVDEHDEDEDDPNHREPESGLDSRAVPANEFYKDDKDS